MENNTCNATAWFALQTRYRYEDRIATELHNKGFESYLPTLRETHIWKDRKKVMDVPAFGGYLFARFEPSLHNRVRVLETAGVVKLLGNHGMPEPVSQTEIESLRLALQSGMPCSREPYVEIGAPVRVCRGPLSGLEGRVLRKGNKLTVFVNIASVCQAIAVEVPMDDLQPMDGTQAIPLLLN
ncbi:MAG TPA: UpxY family transcription antiterminator [Alloacidobacterium sp.]|jgi:transcription antitermination factor NusG|nr:UpxY family transcription antiterminator [Alloacidobacterium sp.]